MIASLAKFPVKALPAALAAGLATAAAAEFWDSDAAWNLLNLASVSEAVVDDTWFAVKAFPEELRAATDDFLIEGYVVPILAEPEISSFILVQDPENCPFCGTGSGYAPVLEVILGEPIPSVEEFSRIRVQGELELIDDPQTFQMFVLVNAAPVS
ncbi:MAG: hypothetical protein AAFP13_02030 [Pseudomonadota bacterium]